MTPLKLVLAFIRRKPATWSFHGLTLAVAVAATGAVLLVEQAARVQLARDLAGVDLVVGAEGSPLQLVMSTLFQADVPTGNIPLAEADSLAADPLVATAVPLSLGDSFGGARIVGTTRDYAALYGARLDRGRWWSSPLEAVVGAEVARRQGLAVGDAFAGAHGLSPGGYAHEGEPYRVVGVLAPTGAVIDRVILTDVASVWALHDHENAGATDAPHPDEVHGHGGSVAPEADRQVTAVLIRYRSSLGAVVLPPKVARIAGLQAASPPRETQRLNGLLGAGAGALARLGQGLLALAGVGFIVAMSAAILARRRELALLKALGASRARLAVLVSTEGVLLGLAGGIAGVVLARGLSEAVARWGGAPLSLPIAPPSILDLALVGAAGLIGLLASLPAAIIAGRTDPVDVLGEG
ncbi:ABC transporter permease [Brevundimonas sp.]|uniref:ABC transporter permease n=1 Tax=Brevundimonas sp. TaxID=1871086 RepID=UPI002D48AF06|nr:ABC transporter permease [Brevundimonas sp.]HYC73824.1 ABC transporter permease [Brevundimonas sp.]